MKRSAATVSLVAYWCVASCISTILRAEQPATTPLVVDLWPGKAPEEPGAIGPEKVVMSPKFDRKQVEVTESTRMLSNVTKPSITICRPAKDKDIGTAVL